MKEDGDVQAKIQEKLKLAYKVDIEKLYDEL